MHFHILTLFPEMVEGGLNTSILGRACQKGLISLEAVNIRDYTQDKHNKVDDYPYGGGAGMLMQAQPVYDAFCAVRKNIEDRGGRRPRVIYVTPQGQVFHQQMARELAKEEDLVFLCGHYEGIDERVLSEIVTDCVSIGDYVLTGGELPAMVMIDAISRMVPGVLKNEESGEFESFHENLLEYPQYTRPEVWREKAVPEVLLSGDHARVDAWRLEQSVERTRQRRPDLYEKYDLPGRALAWLYQDKLHHMDMIEAIRRGTAEVVSLREDGVLLRDQNCGLYLLSAAHRDAGERLLSLVEAGASEIACHQPFLAESAVARWGWRCELECFQAVYTKKSPLPVGQAVEIRALQEADLDAVEGGYHGIVDREYLRRALREERLFGAFLPEEGGLLAGFIGRHEEGSMGLLTVLEPFRRRGIGTALESWMINRMLEMGQTPYCQVIAGNEVSLGLQKKLGLKLSRKRIFWIANPSIFAESSCKSDALML